MEQLNHNLALIHASQPELANKFAGYAPSTVTRVLDGNDLCCEGELFYACDANVASQAQVQQYLAKPSHYTLTYKTEETPRYEHQKVINSLNAKARELGYPLAKTNASTLIVLGSGLGFHLEHLVSVNQYGNIIVVEPDNDMLFHFLCTIDIDKLSAHCQQNGGVLTILQPKSAVNFTEQISKLVQQVGYGLFSEMDFYRHYETPLFNDIFDNIKSIRHKWLSTWGFFGDEMISLNHSLANARAHQRFFLGNKGGKKQPTKTTPVLIVGNGPSLDADIERLKTHHQQFTLVSCGSALPVLLKFGIMPDIHVEMERTAALYDLIEPSLTDDFCQNTLLIALNTVAPKLISSFKRSLLFTKANDLGAMVLKPDNQETIQGLYFCNPTVTNLAVSACIALGFEHFVMLGCDYGYKDPERHHASTSEYYNPKSMIAGTKFSNELEVPGNFGGVVGTERIFNLSRTNIEQLLIRNPQVNCINCADGALIKGAEPQRFEQYLLNRTQVNKTKPALDKLLPLADFERLNINEKLLSDTLNGCIDYISAFAHALKQPLNAKKLKQLLTTLTYDLDTQKHRTPEFFLLSGVTRYFSVSINGHLGRMSADNAPDYVHHATERLGAFCDDCLKTLTGLLTSKTN